ncbi:hypothetical protein GCM10010502_42330 [Kitasatospora aureofaciens]|uniref:ADP-ribosylglycohydrolase n=1 Tax=Kitasatospora aureofaciens TaxID=1894 RepID=A0A8H9HU77_KITAU|nr:hypothetical protein GCM10010502_42330 [Kitasatospora aureofaciens]
MTDPAAQTGRAGRAAGAVLGAAVGDALGAPYEFGPAGGLSARFPAGNVELVAGGGWEIGEATDDTQMAVLVAESLIERGSWTSRTSSAGSAAGPPPTPRTSGSRPSPSSPAATPGISPRPSTSTAPCTPPETAR